MSRFYLSVEASATYGADAPILEVIIDSTVVASGIVTAVNGMGTNLFMFDLLFSGDYPTGLSLRFNDGSAEGGRTVEIERLRVNGQELDGSLIDQTTLSQSQSGNVDSASVDYLFGVVEPTLGDVGPATITGTALDDNIAATVGDDIIDAQAGEDIVSAGAGEDYIFGGGGNDTLDGGADNDVIVGGLGNDRIFGGDGDDILHGGDNNDFIRGADGNDTVNGGDGHDRISAGTGDDTIYGGDGNDRIFGDDGADTISGGLGDDIIVGGAGNDDLSGDGGIDRIAGFSGDDLINGGAGDDLLDGGLGNDVINGGDDNDLISGRSGNDTLNGGTGNDTIYGEDGNDTLNGGDGNDTLYATQQWYDADFSFSQTITIDSSFIGASLTDFTVYFDGSGLGSRFWNNVNADGSDMVFTSSNGATLLETHIVDIDTGTQTLEVLVKVPELSSTVDTEILLYYGNGGATLNTATELFGDTYTGAYQFEDDLGTDLVTDSSSQNNDGGARSGLNGADIVDGVIGQAYQYNNAEYIALDKSFSGANSVNEVSVSAWINTTFSGGSYNTNWAILDFDRSEFFNVFVSGDTGQLSFSTSDGAIDDFAAGPAINDGAWHHITAVYDGTDKILYVDGAEVARKANAHGGDALGTNTTRYGFIGDGSEADTFDGGRNNIYYEGQLDEVRLYEGVLSAEAIAAEYNNYTDTANFISADTFVLNNLSAGDDTDILNGGGGNDTLYASDGADELYGGAGDDILYGGIDSNILEGGDGDDIIYADPAISSANNAASTSLSTEILSDSPIAYWQFDEAGGTNANNQGSGASINGTLQNGASFGGGALYTGGTDSVQFDGTNDYVSIPNSSLINTSNIAERTVEFLFNADNLVGRQVLYEEGGGTNALVIYLDGNQLYFNARDSGDFGPFTINETVSSGQTYHVAAVLSESAGTFTGYLDGVQVDTPGVVTRSLSSHSGAIGIGGMDNDTYFHDGAASGDGFYFEGRISDFAIYNSSLSQSDIQERVDLLSTPVLGPFTADDTIRGGEGFDQLYGGDGQDTFIFETLAEFNDVDEVNNFNIFEGDTLDISDLLSGFVDGVSDINDFVTLTDNAGNTVLSVDVDGSGGPAVFQDLAQLNDVSGLSVDTLYSNDLLGAL